jgi:prefoldin subunit 5
MSQASNLLATIKRLKGYVSHLEARIAELEELLARALAVSEAMESMLNGVLEGPGEHEAA